jgi:hypothetical protein
MSFSQFLALLAFIAAALPLGAIALVTLLYGAVAIGRAPAEAAALFERHAGRLYCWAMIADLALAMLLINGWTVRLLLLAAGASFLRALLDVLPRLEALRAGAPPVAPVAGNALVRWRRIVAAACAVQWLTVLAVYVKLVL